MRTIIEKLFDITHHMDNIEQDQTKGIPYKITSWNKVNSEVKKQLKENKVLIIPRVLEHTKEGNLTTVRMNAEIINVENTSDRITLGDYVGYGIDSSDKGIGKAISYAYKYMLMKLFMTSVGIDEDSEFSNPPITKTSNEAQQQTSRGL